MWLYLLIFLIPVVSYYYPFRKDTYRLYFLACYLTFLAFFVGMADMFGGYDRYIYGDCFDTIADVTSAHGSYLYEGVFDYFPTEYGYTVINIIISFFTANRYVFILLITFSIYILLFVSLRKYAKDYPLALILFMGLWFYFTFTYLRQVLGVTIVWLSIDYIVKRRFWRFFAVFLVACLVHKSAVIFFPLYFIPVRKYSRQTVLIIMFVMFVVGLSPIPNTLFMLYGDVSVIEMQSDYHSAGGFRIAYVLEAVFFLYVILTNYRYVGNKPVDYVTLNMALVFCAVLLFFVRSEDGGRLAWYFMLGVIVTVSNLIVRGSNRSAWSALAIGVCLVLYVRVYTSWQVYLNLYPYKTFLTNGFRAGDYSHEFYEYDSGYDKDKLYRAPFRIEFNL